METGATIGGWSSSWRLPLPQRFCGARPPTTTIGEPANWAWAMALTPLVTPGPAVRTARPGTRVSLPVASAANAAVCSWRTSSSRIGGSALTAPSYIGNTCAPGQREHGLDAVGAGDGDGQLAGVAGQLGWRWTWSVMVSQRPWLPVLRGSAGLVVAQRVDHDQQQVGADLRRARAERQLQVERAQERLGVAAARYGSRSS